MHLLSKITKYLLTLLLLFGVASTALSYSENFSHIEQLFDIRTSITDQGKTLPEDIREAEGSDLRTLERIFELNTSTLTTIEAYFRIFKIALTSNEGIDPSAIAVINEWLSFIQKQCKYDIEYIDQALSETTNESVIDQLTISRENIEKLQESTRLGIRENSENLQKQASR